MLDILFVGLLVYIYFTCFHKPRPAPAEAAVGFTDGPVDMTVLEFTKAYVQIADHHYDCCRYFLEPNGVHMAIQDYADDYIVRVLIENNNATAYLKALEMLGDDGDAGWILRHFGHEADYGYWDADIKTPISKSTAEKAYEILSKSTRVYVSKSDSEVRGHKGTD